MTPFHLRFQKVYSSWLNNRLSSTLKFRLSFLSVQKYHTSIDVNKYFFYKSSLVKTFFTDIFVLTLFIILFNAYISRFSYTSFFLDYTSVVSLILCRHFFDDNWKSLESSIYEFVSIKNNINHISKMLGKKLKSQIQISFFLMCSFFYIKYFNNVNLNDLPLDHLFFAKLLILVLLQIINVSLFFYIFMTVFGSSENINLKSRFVVLVLSFLASSILLKSLFLFLQNISIDLIILTFFLILYVLFLVISFLYDNLYWK